MGTDAALDCSASFHFPKTECVFQPNVDAVSNRTWTAFQTERGRCFSVIVDDGMGVVRK